MSVPGVTDGGNAAAGGETRRGCALGGQRVFLREKISEKPPHVVAPERLLEVEPAGLRQKVQRLGRQAVAGHEREAGPGLFRDHLRTEVERDSMRSRHANVGEDGVVTAGPELVQSLIAAR